MSITSIQKEFGCETNECADFFNTVLVGKLLFFILTVIPFLDVLVLGIHIDGLVTGPLVGRFQGKSALLFEDTLDRGLIVQQDYEEAFAAAFVKGRDMSLDEAIAYALEVQQGDENE